MNAPHGIRLLSWNVNRRTDVAQQVAVIAHQQPDIVAMQEVTPRTRPRWHEALQAAGLPYITDSWEVAADQSIFEGARRFIRLTASRWPLTALSPQEFVMPWTEAVVSCVIYSPAGNIEMHNVHVPPGASHKWLKIETLEAIYQRLAIHSNEHRILCGDFNTPQTELPDGTLITWGQTPAGRISKGMERWDAGERSVMVNLAEFGLVDVYRALYGYVSTEFSWYSNNNGRQVGRRFDHVFASPSLNPVSCEYLHAWRISGLSDHAAVEVLFGPEMKDDAL